MESTEFPNTNTFTAKKIKIHARSENTTRKSFNSIMCTRCPVNYMLWAHRKRYDGGANLLLSVAPKCIHIYRVESSRRRRISGIAYNRKSGLRVADGAITRQRRRAQMCRFTFNNGNSSAAAAPHIVSINAWDLLDRCGHAGIRGAVRGEIGRR